MRAGWWRILPLSDPACLIAVVGEDKAHRHVVSSFGDRILCDEVAWIDRDTLLYYRRWQGRSAAEDYFPIHKALVEARKKRLPMYGRFGRGPDVKLFRAALLLMADQDRIPQAVVIARDIDSKKSRRQSFFLAVESGEWPFVVVFAGPDPEIESWILCGFEPESPEERARLSTLKHELSFEPNKQPHRLTSVTRDGQRDAKKVLHSLTRGDRDREDRCLAAPWTRLESVGEKCGLAQFLASVRGDVIPLFRDSMRG